MSFTSVYTYLSYIHSFTKHLSHMYMPNPTYDTSQKYNVNNTTWPHSSGTGKLSEFH